MRKKYGKSFNRFWETLSVHFLESTPALFLESVETLRGLPSSPIPPPLIYRNSLTVPHIQNPFFISDSTVINYTDEPPSYSEVVDRGVSPVPCQAKVALSNA
uniref:Uncharacterized protein n=1 Tax=Caenorhabditis japonica TaxID=281687 RepID=A0A8R1HTV8_CAEJA